MYIDILIEKLQFLNIIFRLTNREKNLYHVYMKIYTALVLTFALVAYFVPPFLVLLIKNKKAQNILLWILFGVYICVLLIGVWGKIDVGKKFVYVNFDFSKGWANKSVSFSFKNLTTFDIAVNLIMFMPVGFVVWFKTQNKKCWFKILLLLTVGLCCGLFVEFTQYILPVPRSVQLSDVVFNTISVLVGGLLCALYLLPFKHKSE